jgi:AcrR family transcriptional regulator
MKQRPRTTTTAKAMNAPTRSPAVNAPAKPTADETRARIMQTAEVLFRRLGFAKTAVADIASDLGMSPANVYRFFPSKNAIVEAICQRCLGEVEDKAWAIARARGTPTQRLERLFLEILAYNKENFLADHRVHEVVLVAIEHSWDAIRAHKQVMRTVVELILRDGIGDGTFDAMEPRETADLIMRSMVCYTHPILIGHCIEEYQDLEAEVRASLRFLIRAITPRA